MTFLKTAATVMLAAGLAAGIGSVATSRDTGGGPAGESGARVSGYTVADVRYELDAADPSRVAAVSFRLSPASARQVRVRSGAVELLPCEPVGSRYVCAAGTEAVAVEAIDRLEVVAVA